MKVGLEYLLKHRSYEACNLLPTDRFVDLCKKRGIDVSKKVLERLEELGIFYPLARAKQEPFEVKKEPVDEYGDDRIMVLGGVDDSDDWDEESEARYARFWFGRPDADEWYAEGLLWEPKTCPFVKWDTYRDEKRIIRMESYYSQFQSNELWHKLNLLRRRIAAEFWVTDPEKWADEISGWAKKMVEFERRPFLRYDIPFLCQVISNRYYPLTQTNQRYFQIGGRHDWDWHEFCEQWNAAEVLQNLGMDNRDVGKAWEMTLLDGKSCDPLEDWYDLISYVSVEKKSKLKGPALRAQTWYTMEHMLRLFVEDLTGDQFPTPSGSITYKFVPGIEQPIPPNPLDDLEKLANDYNLNPRPVLILVVEGESESQVLPEETQRLFGSTFEIVGIQVMCLGGVGNFEGKRRVDRYGALERFIDDYHTRCTIVFCILDNEGRVTKVKRRLITKTSNYEPRMLTREEYIKIWDKSIEFDNFTDQEIADAMAAVSGGNVEINVEEINAVGQSDCRNSGKSLEDVYERATGHGLSKPKLLAQLMKFITPDDVKGPADSDGRPIITVLREIVRLAHENGSQLDDWHRESRKQMGLYGELIQPRPSNNGFESDRDTN